MALITIEQAFLLIKYFPETGAFQWNERLPHIVQMYGGDPKSCGMWNTRYLHKPVGTLNSKGYLVTRIMGRAYKLHRLAWFMVHAEWAEEIDHINGDKSDNRIANLRSVTRAENMKNKPKYKQNSSGVIGVGWHKTTNKWIAKIRINGRDYHLGIFETIEGAAAARAAAEVRYGFHKNHGRS